MTVFVRPEQTFCGVSGVILPACGGLGYQQVLDVIHGTAAKARIIGATFVEYVPEKDPSGTGAQAIARLASNLIAAVGGRRGCQLESVAVSGKQVERLLAYMQFARQISYVLQRGKQTAALP